MQCLQVMSWHEMSLHVMHVCRYVGVVEAYRQPAHANIPVYVYIHTEIYIYIYIRLCWCLYQYMHAMRVRIIYNKSCKTLAYLSNWPVVSAFVVNGNRRLTGNHKQQYWGYSGYTPTTIIIMDGSSVGRMHRGCFTLAKTWTHNCDLTRQLLTWDNNWMIGNRKKQHGCCSPKNTD